MGPGTYDFHEIYPSSHQRGAFPLTNQGLITHFTDTVSLNAGPVRDRISGRSTGIGQRCLTYELVLRGYPTIVLVIRHLLSSSQMRAHTF